MADAQIVGVNYFDHQFLRKDDFVQAGEYPLLRQRQHNRLLHLPGLIDGLGVNQGAGGRLELEPGRAVDGDSHEVWLRPTVAPDVPPLLRVQTRTSPDEFRESDQHFSQKLVVDVAQLPEGGGTAYVTIRRATKAVRPSVDPGLEGNPTRFVERPEVEVSLNPPSGDEARLLLATIYRKPDGTLDRVEPTTRRAGAVLADDSVTSAKLAEADGSSAQDASAGSGVKTPHLQNDAVTEPKLGPLAVSTRTLANGAVVEAKLGTGSVSTRALGVGSVTEEKHAAGAVSTRALADDAVASAKLAEADGSSGQDTAAGSGVKTAHLQDGAVTEPKLGAEAVSTRALAADAVTSEKIADADGRSGQDTGRGSGVKTPHLQDGAVAEPKLADAAVSERTLAEGAVTETKLATGAVSARRLADGSVTSAKLIEADNAAGAAPGTYSQDSNRGVGVKTPHLTNHAVTEEKLAPDAVTEPKLAEGAVSTRALGDFVVNARKLGDGSVTSAKLIAADNAAGAAPGTYSQDAGRGAGVKTPHLTNHAVTEAKLATGAVGTRALAERSVLADHIADGAVTQSKLGPDVVVGIPPGGVGHDQIAAGSVSVRQMAAELIATGTEKLYGSSTTPWVGGQGYGSALIPPRPVPAGFYLHSIYVVDTDGMPQGELRMQVYEEMVVHQGITPDDPWGGFGKQWRVYYWGPNTITIEYRLYRVEESAAAR